MKTTSETWQAPTEFAEQCRELYGLDCPPWWGTPRRPDFPTLGGKAALVMEALGYPPMPWQRYVLDVALEIDPATGRFAHREVGLSVPRQQGKLAADVDADDTTLSIAVTDGPRWTTDAAQYPMDLRLGGEVVTVTACSGTSSPQSMTVVRGVNGVVRGWDAGTDVRLATPMILSL